MIKVIKTKQDLLQYLRELEAKRLETVVCEIDELVTPNSTADNTFKVPRSTIIKPEMSIKQAS